MGEVHDGNDFTDLMEQERERGITITSATVTCVWKDKRINIIDTPGHVDFTAEVERSLRILDGAVGVFCAVGGVEPQSETVWYRGRYHIPRLAYTTKLTASPIMSVVRYKQAAQSQRCSRQYPLGKEEDLEGIVSDQHEAVTFDPHPRRMHLEEIPENTWRSARKA